MKTLGFTGLLIAALTMGACFETPTADIAFRCGPVGECPNDYKCREDGCCHLIGSNENLTCELIDASVMLDAAMPDAMPGAVPVLQSLMPMNATLGVGATVDLSVALDQPAPVGGTVVMLMSGDTGVATVPASVTVVEGTNSAMFTVTAQGTGMIAVTATLGADSFDSIITVAG